jgi:hypothetical protein
MVSPVQVGSPMISPIQVPSPVIQVSSPPGIIPVQKAPPALIQVSVPPVPGSVQVPPTVIPIQSQPPFVQSALPPMPGPVQAPPPVIQVSSPPAVIPVQSQPPFIQAPLPPIPGPGQASPPLFQVPRPPIGGPVQLPPQGFDEEEDDAPAPSALEQALAAPGAGYALPPSKGGRALASQFQSAVPKQRMATLTPSIPSKPAGGLTADPSQFQSAIPGGNRQRQATMTPGVSGGTAETAAPTVPLVARSFTSQEIIHLVFDLPPGFQRRELLTALSKYEIADFAAGSFRKHRDGNRLQGRTVPLETLFASQSKPLKKPLLTSVPTPFKKLGAELFQLLLEYTHVLPCKNQGIALSRILTILNGHKAELVDEFFFQLIKQTINNRQIAFLLRTWELFLIVATIFPVSDDRLKWVLAHLAKNSTDPDQRIACISIFLFMRVETRHYLGVTLDFMSDRRVVEEIPTQISRGHAVFGALLYELMWCQKAQFPSLPIPYALHYIINVLKEKNVFRTQDVFRFPANDGMVRDIRSRANNDMTAIAQGDVNVVASLLKMWLKELPNPIIPTEQIAQFQALAEQNKFLAFVEQMPQVHQLTLVYVIGFLQEMARHSEDTGMEKSDLATIFGPCIVNPARVAQNNVDLIQRLTGMSVAFCSRLIEIRDPAIVYPLNPAYLKQAAAPAQKR